MARILTAIPKGEKIGLAFSGGLDTSAAVVWMKQFCDVHCYTANLGQPDEPDLKLEDIPAKAMQLGAKSAKLVDCREFLVSEAFTAIMCGSFQVATAGNTYFNTTPLGRAVTSLELARAMRADGIKVWSDGCTYKGNDIERFYIFPRLIEPEMQFYKPWLDEEFVGKYGGRDELSELLENEGLAYRMPKESAYSTDMNILGATHEAKDLEYLNKSVHIIEPMLVEPTWRAGYKVEKEEVSIAFEKGVPVSINGEKFGSKFELILKATAIAGRHGLGMSDQIEDRIIGAKSRGIYEAPALALLHIVYDRLLTATHNEDMIDLQRSLGRKTGKWLYAGKWFDPQCMMLKDAMTKWIGSLITGEVTIELRAGNDYSILNTSGPEIKFNSAALSMEKEECSFTASDRIGQLTLRDNQINTNREQIASYKKLGLYGTEHL